MASNCIRCRQKYENLIRSDVANIIGSACIVLHERWGYGDKRLTDFCNCLQIVWDAAAKSGIPMKDIVKDRTGFDFEQVTKIG